MLQRYQLMLSSEVIEAVDLITDGKSRSDTIEELLWANRKVKAAAAALGIEKPPQRRRGRPPKNDA